MANSNGRIYVDSSSGISIGDIKEVLRSPSMDIGGIVTNGSINKWAKYKPIRYDSVSGITEAQRRELLYGLKVTSYLTLSGLVGSYSDSSEYSYYKPRGKNTNNEWFRLLDFDGYDHNSVCPVASFHCVNSGTRVYEGTDLIATLYLEPSLPTGNLTLADIVPAGDKSLSNCYFGVVISTISGGSATYRILTQSTVIGTGSVSDQMRSLSLPSSLFSAGNDYTIYPVLSYNAITTVESGSSYPSGLYKVPNVSSCSFHVYPISAGVSYAITEGGFTAAMGAAGRVNWSLTGAFKSNMGTTSGQLLYTIYIGQDKTGEKLVDGQEFYNGQITDTITEHTVTGQARITGSEYLTAVITYRDVDCDSVTTEISTEPLE